jgi:pyruvate kinase
MQGEVSRDVHGDLCDLLAQLRTLRAEILEEGAARVAAWGDGGALGAYAPEAKNLADYLALRRRDLSALQRSLADYGLSSLGRSEAKVEAALDALIATLRRLTGDAGAAYPSRTEIRAGDGALLSASDRIFGVKRDGPKTRVMATMPSEAATDPALARRLIEAGMDCARINCAHDGAEAWARMIANIRAAARARGEPCPILMDIAGPKCRIERLQAPRKYRAHLGDRIFLVTDVDALPKGRIALQPTFPEVVDALDIGAPIWINDGKIGARVVATAKGEAELEITCARAKGHVLKPEKGLNFPSTELKISPLTEKDVLDLDFVAEHADLVGFSFVQTPEDVVSLQEHLEKRRGAKPPQPLVLKIETPLAVHNLPRLIVQSARRHPTAVMIARGDLAVELGFARLSEIQEELLWLCEAAHVPVIWATQVLDQFVREGVLNRAETTDAAMAQRAECVMLNKGPKLVEGVGLLRDILSRMDRHYAKKFARFTELKAWG